MSTEGRGETTERAPSRGPWWRDPRARLWSAAAAGAALLLLMLPWSNGGPGGVVRVGRSPVERRPQSGFELVSTSWRQEEDLRPPEAETGGTPEELRLLNEARERWRNLDLVVGRW